MGNWVLEIKERIMRKMSSMLILSMLLSCSNQGALVTTNITSKSDLSVDTINKFPDNKVSIVKSSALPMKKVEQINKVNDTKLVKDSNLVSKNILSTQVSSSPASSPIPSVITVTSPTPILASTVIPSPTYTIDPDPYSPHLQTSPMTENDQNLVPIKESDKGQGHQATGTGDPRIDDPLPSYIMTSYTRPYSIVEILPSSDSSTTKGFINLTFKDDYKVRLKNYDINGDFTLLNDKDTIFMSLTGENVDSINNIIKRYKISYLDGHQSLCTEEKASADKKSFDLSYGSDNPNYLSQYFIKIKKDINNENIMKSEEIRNLIVELRNNPLVRECNFNYNFPLHPD